MSVTQTPFVPTQKVATCVNAVSVLRETEETVQVSKSLELSGWFLTVNQVSTGLRGFFYLTMNNINHSLAILSRSKKNRKAVSPLLHIPIKISGHKACVIYLYYAILTCFSNLCILPYGSKLAGNASVFYVSLVVVEVSFTSMSK